jgi:CRP-like cAMP-binding protein
MEQDRITGRLADSELFKGLSRGGLTQIASICRIERRSPGEFVFRQGDLGEELYVILEGLVVLQRSLDLGGRSGKANIASLGRGRALGCWSTLLDGPRTLMSSALCERPTTLAAFKGSELMEFMTHDKEIGYLLLRNLCFLLRERVIGAYGAMERL